MIMIVINFITYYFTYNHSFPSCFTSYHKLDHSLWTYCLILTNWWIITNCNLFKSNYFTINSKSKINLQNRLRRQSCWPVGRNRLESSGASTCHFHVFVLLHTKDRLQGIHLLQWLRFSQVLTLFVFNSFAFLFSFVLDEVAFLLELFW